MLAELVIAGALSLPVELPSMPKLPENVVAWICDYDFCGIAFQCGEEICYAQVPKEFVIQSSLRESI